MKKDEVYEMNSELLNAMVAIKFPEFGHSPLHTGNIDALMLLFAEPFCEVEICFCLALPAARRWVINPLRRIDAHTITTAGFVYGATLATALGRALLIHTKESAES